MKIKELIEKLDDGKIIFINGKQWDEKLSEDILEKEIKKINIETKKIPGEDLEGLGYSFEIGV